MRWLGLWAALVGWGVSMQAQAQPFEVPRACDAAEGEEAGPWVYMLTMWPGPDIWSRFGHNGVWVREGRWDKGTVYNFGVFEESADLVNEWLQGRQYYWLGTRPFDSMMRLYTKERRDVRAQRLALPPGVAAEMVAKLKWHAEPERRRYLYHWSDCNCSTRARDVLDEALGGALRPQHEVRVETMTKRTEVLRHVAATWWLWFGLNLVTGPALDAPLSWWEVMFLPERMYERLKVSEAQWPGGERRPLVAGECVLNEGSQPYAWEEAPRRGGVLGGVGVVLGAWLAALGWWAGAAGWRRGRRAVLGAAVGLLGLVLAALGVVGVWLWWASEIEAFDASRNLWLVSPLCALWVVGGVWVAGGWGRGVGARRVRGVVMGVPAALATVGVVLGWMPWEVQDNGAMQALFWPLLVGGWAGVWAADRAAG